MKKKIKYRTGTGMAGVSVPNYIPSPDETLAKNEIMQNVAEVRAMTNPASLAIQTLTPVLQSFMAASPGMFDKTEAPKAAYGRKKKKLAYGLIDEENEFAPHKGQQPNAELEGGEIIDSPEMAPQKIQGPSHDQGGVDANLPEGTNVFANKVLGEDGKTMAKRKELREKRRQKFLEKLEANIADRAVINSVKRSLTSLQQEEEEDLQTQEVAGAFANLLGLPHTESGDEQAMMAYGHKARKYAFGNNPRRPSQGTIEDEDLTTQLANLYVNSKATGQEKLLTDLNTGVEDILSNDQAQTESVNNTIATADANNKLLANTVPSRRGARTNSDGTTSTHLMAHTEADGKFYAYPTLFQNETGDWEELSDDDNWAAFNRAMEIGEAREFPTAEEAQAFAEGNWKNSEGEDWQKQPKQFGKKVSPHTDPNIAQTEDHRGYAPTVGDFTKLMGNVFGAVAPLVNTLQNRAGDTPHPNYMKGVGRDALQTIEGMESTASAIKDLQMQRNRSNASSARRRSRQSARGLNTMRALDLILEMGVNQADLDVMNNFLTTRLGIADKKATVQLQSAQAEAQGAVLARDNTDKDRDQFFTNKGKNLSNIAHAIQQTGKDLNQIQQNPIQMNLIEAMSEYFYVDRQGRIRPKGKTMAKPINTEEQNG